MKKTLRAKCGGGLTRAYDLRSSGLTKEKADSLARVIRNSGKHARVIKRGRGDYAVYVS